MRSVTALFLLFLSCSAFAQTIGTCDQGEATADLDVGNVRAGLFNGGNLFYSSTTGAFSAYEVPKDSGMSAAFAAQLWLGGMVQGELRTASATFVNQEFWPGPLDPSGNPPTDCSAYDRIFKVNKTHVEHYLQTGEATDDLREWPHDLGAPVLDGDGNPNNYNLEGGDQPAIWGDQTAWWVMNDLGNEHTRSQGDPLGIEVQVTAFAVDTPLQAYEDATYYIYRLLNKSTLPMDSMFATFWWDTDIGDVGEYAGSDTTLMMAYAYNTENDPVYGDRPPALGVKLLQGPIVDANGLDDDGDGDVDEVGERMGMTSAGMAFNASTEPGMGDPFLSHHYYNVMRGLWRDGTPITEGGRGYQTGGPETKFVFPGDPVAGAYWSELNTDGSGSGNGAGNKRGLLSTGPFVIEPGGEQEIAFAIVFGRGSNNLDSITWMRIAANAIQEVYDEGGFDPELVESQVEQEPEGAESIFLSRVAPNPITDEATIRYSLPAAMNVRLEMFDVLGREVAVLVDGEHARGEYEVQLDGNALRPGVYLVRLEAGNASRTIRFTKR
ncbi:MAG: T9SS type A sorting domain-containing protein [Bacteroidetes bacterium]|nr:T9SS type A sorting domain-containing protein [Bacteroidota bacterium]